MSFITRNHAGFLLMESLLALLLFVTATFVIKSYWALIFNGYQEQKNQLQASCILDEYITSKHYKMDNYVNDYKQYKLYINPTRLSVSTTSSLSLPPIYCADISLVNDNSKIKTRAIFYAD